MPLKAQTSPTLSSQERLHATCIAIKGKGVLLLGPSGSGKSDLALRLIDSGAKLVADDQVIVVRKGKKLWAKTPPKIAGVIEGRGAGLFITSHLAKVRLALAVALVERDKVERLPEHAFLSCLDTSLPLLSLHAFDASTCAKIRLFLKRL